MLSRVCALLPLCVPWAFAAGNSKGFGFVSFDCFEASDAAIEGMNGQYLCNRQITVSYAYKKDTKGKAGDCPQMEESFWGQHEA